jgi:hypothetical protein
MDETKIELISDFLDAEVLNAFINFFEDKNECINCADVIAKSFGATNKISEMSVEDDKKLLTSFKKNLTLLVQKTWVEKSDIALKDELLYHLENFKTSDSSWKDDFEPFLNIINNAVLLMFGQSTESDDFVEYSLRIDPEFGIFWWYISNLPPKANWTEEKCRVATLIGMYFLSNY